VKRFLPDSFSKSQFIHCSFVVGPETFLPLINISDNGEIFPFLLGLFSRLLVFQIKMVRAGVLLPFERSRGTKPLRNYVKQEEKPRACISAAFVPFSGSCFYTSTYHESQLTRQNTNT